MVQNTIPHFGRHRVEVQGEGGVLRLELLVFPHKAVVVVEVVEKDVGGIILNLTDLHLHTVQKA